MLDESESSTPPKGCQFLDGRERGVDLWVNETSKEILLWRPGFQLIVDFARNIAEAQLTDVSEWQNVLRVLYFFSYLSADGLLIHASGVVRQGHGYIFPGPSGSGKTTIVRQSPGMSILSDDLLGIDLSKGRVFALGTPFYGDWGTPGEAVKVPVKGLYFPTHGLENIIVPLTYEMAVKKLLSCEPFAKLILRSFFPKSKLHGRFLC